MMKRMMILAVAALMVMTLPSFAHANLLANDSFETEGGGNWWQAADWTQEHLAGPLGGDHGADRESWTGEAHTGTYFMALKNWSSNQEENQVSQEVIASEGVQYTYSLWAVADKAYTGNFYMRLAWYDGGSLLSTDAEDKAIGTSYAQYTLTGVAPAGADTVRAIFGANTTTDLTFKCDDAAIDGTGTPIPEPTSMLLLGSGLVGLLGFSRKKLLK